MERQRRVTFSVELRSGSARFRVGVQAQSVREAMRLVGGRYPHQGVVRMAFPTEARSYLVPERIQQVAA
jgi:hypothetical protein